MNKVLAALFLLAISTTAMPAQTAQPALPAPSAFVPESEAVSHQLLHPAPVYPAIAKATHVQGTVMYDSGAAPAALIPLRKAVESARLSLTPVHAGYASAYLSLALDEHALRMTAEADYATAEASCRHAILHLPDMKKQYTFSLSRALAFHSGLESQTNHTEHSKALATEALQLDPNAFAGIVDRTP